MSSYLSIAVLRRSEEECIVFCFHEFHHLALNAGRSREKNHRCFMISCLFNAEKTEE
jgi:hypothetical protein